MTHFFAMTSQQKIGLAIAIVAIGYVMSTNVRGVRALENHVALVQTAQTVLTTAIPPRKELAPGRLAGQIRDYGWQVDIGPVGGMRLDKGYAAHLGPGRKCSLGLIMQALPRETRPLCQFIKGQER